MKSCAGMIAGSAAQQVLDILAATLLLSYQTTVADSPRSTAVVSDSLRQPAAQRLSLMGGGLPPERPYSSPSSFDRSYTCKKTASKHV